MANQTPSDSFPGAASIPSPVFVASPLPPTNLPQDASFTARRRSTLRPVVDMAALPQLRETAASNSTTVSPAGSRAPSRTPSFTNNGSILNGSFVNNSFVAPAPGVATVEQLARLTPQQQRIVLMAQRRQSVTLAASGIQLSQLPGSRRTSNIVPSEGGALERVFSGERGTNGLIERVFSTEERGEPIGPPLALIPASRRESTTTSTAAALLVRVLSSDSASATAPLANQTGSRRTSTSDQPEGAPLLGQTSSSRRGSRIAGGNLERVLSGERGSFAGTERIISSKLERVMSGVTPAGPIIHEDALELENETNDTIDGSSSHDSKGFVGKPEPIISPSTPNETVRRMSLLAAAGDSDDFAALVDEEVATHLVTDRGRRRSSRSHSPTRSLSVSQSHSARGSSAGSSKEPKYTSDVYSSDFNDDAHLLSTPSTAERPGALGSSLPALASQVARSVQQLAADAAEVITRTAEGLVPNLGMGGGSRRTSRTKSFDRGKEYTGMRNRGASMAIRVRIPPPVLGLH
ncbi:hypothetical protein HDU93_007168 [Gonapodya sp. JEL0774]|nr:hypothetical protein HDU93_007168 [Gonapodya sp. JEL0774]